VLLEHCQFKSDYFKGWAHTVVLQPGRLRDAGALELPRDRQKLGDTTKDKKTVSFYGDVDGEGLLDQLEKRAASESVELAKKDDYN
jgi:hypothetical protein